MGLRATAAADAKAILEDLSGFGWPLLVLSPEGQQWELTGLSTDVGQAIDPDTGQAIAGRRASVSVSMASLPVVPEVMPDDDRKPWRVSFANSTGQATLWKVVEVMPDAALSVMVFLLEAYHAP